MNNYVATGLSGTSAMVFLIIALWGLFWKGLALWHSARKGQTIWFAVFLVVNALGILEIIYLFGILRLKPKELFKKH